MVLSVYVVASFLTGGSTLASAYRATGGKWGSAAVYLTQSKLSLLMLCNWAVCVLWILCYGVKWLFLGSLREAERNKLQEKLVNYVLFKLMFMAAMMEHSVGGGAVGLWAAWFVGCALLKTFSVLSRERIEFLLGVEHDPASSALLRRPLVLVGLDLALTLGVLGAVLWTQPVGFALLLSFELVCIAVDCGHALAKVLVARGSGHSGRRGYVVDFVSDCLVLVASLLHYVHILYILGVSFTLIDVILLLNMRSIVLSLTRKYRSYRVFLAMEAELRDRYPTVEGADIGPDQVCAICREPMESAKRLPCQHLYHLGCIRSWLEQNQHNCPMCRYDLRKAVGAPAAAAAANNNGNDNNNDDDPPLAAAAAPWFLPFANDEPAAAAAELQQLRDMFPNVDPALIAADLARTGSLEETIENLVEGRIPAMMVEQEMVVVEQEEVAVEQEEVAEQEAPVAAHAEPARVNVEEANVLEMARNEPAVRRRLLLDAALRRADDV